MRRSTTILRTITDSDVGLWLAEVGLCREVANRNNTLRYVRGVLLIFFLS